ncbi:uncharacterized protein LOC105846392 isoform X1 [Hydra vulgaris]|uniref:uncharacterized protein LOC105846392 isoform X1 n=1 Tax=Hydra vulgaris TaxID=6087 RepID=UPI001F5E4FF2|nr:uncharacterized protein LOC105846392 isoform X1 [Hydra vulgaris]XP_047136556.1 uncharacterized protein LOC105846392 isoform X1 [Hydra vulgaris]XP_047136557.1 uncharacterized protein LOC105846392 isoform X1 [Hydra vulgaris]
MNSRTCLLLAVFAILQQCYSLLDLSEKSQPSKAERTAAEAINKLLQEKMASKFKEAANEVKGALVKHLGDSLKSAHKKMIQKKKKKTNKKTIKKQFKSDQVAKANKVLPLSHDTPNAKLDTGIQTHALTSPCHLECRSKFLSHSVKCRKCKAHVESKSKLGAAIHQNTGPRNRKNLSTVKQAPTEVTHNVPASTNYDSNSGNQIQQQSAQLSPLPVQNYQYQHPAQLQMQQTNNQVVSAGIPPMGPSVACNPVPTTCTGNDCMSSNPCADVFSRLGPSTSCPPTCGLDCFGYCPTACCRHKKKTNIPKIVENKTKE